MKELIILAMLISACNFVSAQDRGTFNIGNLITPLANGSKIASKRTISVYFLFAP